jgi:PAS domain S-box-containing protein
MGEGVIVIGQNRLIQLFNPAAGALTGWDPESAQNLDYRAVLSLKNPDDSDVTDATDPFVAAWTGQKTVIKNNLSLMTKSGRKTAITITVSPISVDNLTITGAIALFRDISEEKEVERQRNEFISTASHEMRTPVAAIEGYIALAMNPNVASIDERARGFLVKAHDSTTHLGELFRDLLSITKVEEGKLAGHIEAVDMGKLITDVVSDMQFNAQKHNLTLLLQSGGQMMDDKAILPLFTVMGNPERLREVTMNLIDNALKYTPEGGITVDITGTKDTVVVRVKDTGSGIAAEDISHLIQKFYRVDSTATRTVGGTGLGLYLCRNIIEAYNGRIWVESELGKGSSFNYSLPRIENSKLKEASEESNVVLIQPEAAPQLTEQPVPVVASPVPTGQPQP